MRSRSISPVLSRRLFIATSKETKCALSYNYCLRFQKWKKLFQQSYIHSEMLRSLGTPGCGQSWHVYKELWTNRPRICAGIENIFTPTGSDWSILISWLADWSNKVYVGTRHPAYPAQCLHTNYPYAHELVCTLRICTSFKVRDFWVNM